MNKISFTNCKKILQQTAITLLFALVILTFIRQPSRYMKVFFDGLTVWAHNVLPVLFPFALITTLYTRNCKFGKVSISKAMFRIGCDNVFLSSLLCGYPVGARAICEEEIDPKTATAMCSFCSTPNPIFIIATVGSLLNNTTATAIVCVSQVVAMLLNGWAYTANKQFDFVVKSQEFDSKDFGNTLTNVVLSVLSVGGLIAVFFMLAEMLQVLLPASISQHPAVFFALGLLEMTSGILKICNSCDLLVATVCTSALLAFGGLCIAMQCFAFVSQKGVKFAKLLQMKCTQCAFATIISFALAKIFL